MAKKYDIVPFGEALIDFTPTVGGAYMPNPGGAPFNLAACAAKFGVKTAFIGKLGKDAFGALIQSTAKSLNVDTAYLLWDQSRVTTHTFVTLDENGDRSFVFCREHGADLAISREELPLTAIQNTRVFHFGGLSLTGQPIKDACLYAVDTAKAGGAAVSFDPNYRPLLWDSRESFVNACRLVLDKVDILKVSVEEALLITDTDDTNTALKILAQTVPVVLVTDGAKGAYGAVGGETVFMPPTAADAVDTTGAGDIFFGTFLAQMLEGGFTPWTLNAKLVLSFGVNACRYAAKSTEKYGAIPSIPNFSR